ncbi:hypothetical protein STIP28_8 [Synechococcus T7-like virus S-TIP28]|uniref:Uncharacterized protein n=1 Tax=Synechococcus T7-like virus S-TIP28 TaxID=1332140 RepID=A0AAE8XJ52_9CAUD|nr:hypothetical protein STIP28_8 [Synechococcus T7-like virus S-TIP28]
MKSNGRKAGKQYSSLFHHARGFEPKRTINPAEAEVRISHRLAHLNLSY